MRVSDTVRKCVLTIGVIDGDDLIYGGTAFLVAVPAEVPPGSCTYLVTCRHCITDLADRPYMLRANTRDGHSVNFEGAGTKWWFHDDDTVDLAIVVFNPPPEIDLDVRYVPLATFLTNEDIQQHKIGSGDEVYMTGLFTEIPGGAKNLPIVRTGTIALIPDEKIPFGKDLISAYLIEGRSIGGLSGSPAFVSETLMADYESHGNPEKFWVSGKTFFLGVTIGHWDVPLKLSLLDKEKVNMGISVVVPAKKLQELLNQPEHIDMRRRAEREKRDRGSATLDSALSPSFTQKDFEDALRKASRKIKR